MASRGHVKLDVLIVTLGPGQCHVPRQTSGVSSNTNIPEHVNHAHAFVLGTCFGYV